MSDLRAGTPIDQDAEEARHLGAASLTAVRIWPMLSKYVDTHDHLAQRLFVAILTSYKALATAEARQPTRKVVKQIRQIQQAISDGDLDELSEQFVDLTQTPAGLSAATRFLVFVRQQADSEVHVEVPDLASAADRLRGSVAAQASKNENHRAPLVARGRLLRRLAWFFQLHTKFALRDKAGEISRDFTDFLLAINSGLWREIKRSRMLENRARWLPDHIAILVSHKDPTKQARRTLQADLRKRLPRADT